MIDQEFESQFKPRNETHKNRKKKKQEKKKSFARELVSTLMYVIVLTGFFLLIQHFFFAPVSVEGDSMEPTLSHSDRLVLNKIGQVERFDIVVFPAPDEPERQYIKRVIGLPGDEIQYREEILFINGDEVAEPYVNISDEDAEIYNFSTADFSLQTLYGVEEVPEGHYFLLGDNRVNSRDSRSFGFVSEESIIGKTDVRVWPLDHFGFLNGDIAE